MSVGRSPTLCWQLPMYEHMRKNMEAHMNDPSLPVALREALAAGRTKLMHYYDLTKKSMHARMATMCHPGLRAQWFGHLGPDAATQAQVLFEAVYKSYTENEPLSQPAAPAPAPSSEDVDFLETVGAAPDAPEVPVAPVLSECARWFAMEGGKGQMKHPLVWWKEHAGSFPVIARMARDFLAIPGTSVAVERLFLKSRHICVDTRSSLKADTVSEAILAQKWLEDPKLWYGVIEKRKIPRGV